MSSNHCRNELHADVVGVQLQAGKKGFNKMDKMFNWICIVSAGIGGAFSNYLGGFDKWLIALAIFVVIDYLTGLVKAYFNKELSSRVGAKGIIKKVYIFVIIGVAVVMQDLVDFPLREIVISFYLCNEGLSLLENIAVFLPIPEKIKEVLIQLREKTSINKDGVNNVKDN